MIQNSRREALASLAAGAALSVLSPSKVFGQAPLDVVSAKGSATWPIAVFGKIFEGLDYKRLGETLAQIDTDGIEATVRPGGHIEPDRAPDEVPKMVAALKQHDRSLLIAATAVNDANEPLSRKLLEALVASGVRYYRMGYYRYDLSKPVQPQLESFAAQARELAQLNIEVGIQGLYQNHSGSTLKQSYVGALGFDAVRLLEGIDANAIGLAVDTLHLRVETGSSWPTAASVCKPKMRAIYIKDGKWAGERTDNFESVPLDTGFVNRQMFDTIRQDAPMMPLSVYMEWLGYRVFKVDELPSAIEAYNRDIATLRSWLV